MCVVLAATSERLTGSRVLEGALVGIVAPSDLAGSILVEIFYCGEGGNIEQVARTRNNSLVFAIAHLSLSQLTCV